MHASQHSRRLPVCYDTTISNAVKRRDSERCFRAAIDAAPLVPAAHNNLACVAFAQGRIDEVIRIQENIWENWGKIGDGGKIGKIGDATQLIVCHRIKPSSFWDAPPILAAICVLSEFPFSQRTSYFLPGDRFASEGESRPPSFRRPSTDKKDKLPPAGC